MRQLLRRQPHGQVRRIKRARGGTGAYPPPPARPRGDLRTCISRDKHDHTTRQTKPPCAGFRHHRPSFHAWLQFFRICESVSFCSQSPPGVLAFARTARPTQAGKILAYPEKNCSRARPSKVRRQTARNAGIGPSPERRAFPPKSSEPFPFANPRGIIQYISNRRRCVMAGVPSRILRTFPTAS